jgi:streptogramin lyase
MLRFIMVVLITWIGCTSDMGTVVDGGVEPTETMVTVLVGETASGTRNDTGVRARFNGVSGMAIAPNGRVLIADRFNAMIRAVDPMTLVVTTHSGVALEASVVDGALTDARWQSPTSIAFDDDGNIYVGDGPCIRRIHADDGVVSTFAGSCSQLGQLDADDLLAARFGRQLLDLEVVIDALGTLLFVVDRDNNAIRVIDVDQESITLADFDDGLFGPSALVNDGDAVLVSNTGRHTIARIDLNDRALTTFAGIVDVTGDDDGPLATATFDQPQALIVVGDSLMVGGFTGSLRRIDRNTNIVTTLPAHSEGFFANGVSLPDGSAWVGDIANAVVRITDDGATTILGTDDPRGHRDGVGQDARFGICLSMSGDNNNGIVLTDLLHHTIRRVDLTTLAVTTLAGQVDVPGRDDGPVATATLRGPSGIITAPSGDIFFSELEGCRLRVLSNGEVRTIAGSDVCDVIDGSGSDAAFAAPRELAFDDNGVLFVADHLPADGVVRRVDVDTGVVTTIARGMLFPRGMVFADGKLWVGDFESHTLSTVDPSSGELQKLVGVPEQSGAIDGGRLVSLLNQPNGMGAGNGYVLMAELGNQQLRRFELDTLGSRMLFNNLPGSMPGGDSAPLSTATILNPLDVWVRATDDGDEWYLFADGAIVRMSQVQ